MSSFPSQSHNKNGVSRKVIAAVMFLVTPHTFNQIGGSIDKLQKKEKFTAERVNILLTHTYI